MVTRLERAEPGIHGAIKKPKQFMLTDAASEMLDVLAEELGVTRSEALELAIRGGISDAAKRYKRSMDLGKVS